MKSVIYIRNFIFGVEDSLASTVGLLSCVAAAGVPEATIILTGLVLISVEAFSMAVGSFVSEESAEEYLKRGDVSPRKPLVGSLVMFFSYFVAGFIPLLPYAILDVRSALITSIVLSLAALFVLGITGAGLSHTNKLKHGMRMFFIGGVAVLVGVVVGG